MFDLQIDKKKKQKKGGRGMYLVNATPTKLFVEFL